MKIKLLHFFKYNNSKIKIYKKINTYTVYVVQEVQ